MRQIIIRSQSRRRSCSNPIFHMISVLRSRKFLLKDKTIGGFIFYRNLNKVQVICSGVSVLKELNNIFERGLKTPYGYKAINLEPRSDANKLKLAEFSSNSLSMDDKVGKITLAK